jgi:hypothetical protein
MAEKVERVEPRVIQRKRERERKKERKKERERERTCVWEVGLAVGVVIFGAVGVRPPLKHGGSN